MAHGDGTRIATLWRLLLGFLLAVLVGGDAAGVPLVVGIDAHRAVSAGLARTPPMGWNSWNAFGADVRSADIRAAADAIVSSGMRAAGYQYVIIDDGWMAPARDADGNLRADPDRFPEGIAALAVYVHARGLKLGIYESPGLTTCQGLPGSYGHEARDAAAFAAWGVDYLKYDACSYLGLRPAATDARGWLVTGFTRMRNALDATGRPIVYSINPAAGGDPAAQQPWTWAPQVANLWRATNDHVPCWTSTEPLGGSTGGCVADNLGASSAWQRSGGPGHWNDLDMLTLGLTPDTENIVVQEIGAIATGSDTTRLDDTEARSELSIWAMLASPLLAGNDLTRTDASTRAILTNRAVLAVDQDPLGAAAVRLSRTDGLQVWTRRLAGGDTAVLAVNPTATARTANLTAAELSLPTATRYQAKDLWTGEVAASTATADVALPVTLAPHASAMLRLVPDYGPPHTAVHGGVDRRGGATAAVQAEVESGDHLVLALHPSWSTFRADTIWRNWTDLPRRYAE
ncbi:glycoside hydrolase family 27 protein [Frankia sp. AgB32]|nr:glycoside hydrolase family 27 protein [Frankia sp. AgB32]MCK9898335.1 glycoside hydrolase family 27 protein [Frankia sp. AgB32]